MPNLENLRKQAKQILRWHRDRHYPVAVQIRTWVPRYAALSDENILASEFKLSDAQELIARKTGFESWEALLKGFKTMPNSATHSTSRPELLTAEPQLFVRDLAEAFAFYTDRLGFSVVFSYGEPPFYGQVARDGARLNLRCVSEPVIDPHRCGREDLLAATITLDDAKPLYLEYQDAGVSFHQTLRTEPWGARTFIVRDPDANLIMFAGKGS